MRRAAVTGILISALAVAPAALTTLGASPAHAVAAPAGGDITSLITADGGRDDITLQGGDYTITLPATGPKVQQAPELPAVPQTVYHGSISGTGTITLKAPGGGSLVMTGLSTYSLPRNRLRTWSSKQAFARYQYDGVSFNGGKSPWDVDVLHGATNDPVMTVEKGAVLHLNDLDGGRASIESYVGAGGRAAGNYNEDTLRIDGSLVYTNAHHSPYETTIGPLTGTGNFINHQGGFRMSGTSTISGHVLVYGANINGAWARGELTGVSKIYNALDLAYGATPRTVPPAGTTARSSGVEVVPQTIYECCYGNALYNIGSGEVRFTGKYSYSDSQDQLRPGLSNPKLNYVSFPKGNSFRNVDLGAGFTTFGDGTDADFFLPSSGGNALIVTHHSYALGFDYDGPVVLNAPINRPDEINDVNLFVLGTQGNKLIVTQPLWYHGVTRIDRKATLQLGDRTKGNWRKDYRFFNKQINGMDTGTYGTSSGSGRILTADSAPGKAGDRIVVNGTLAVANRKGSYSGVGAIALSDVSGRGGLVQRGPATLTLLSHIAYRGPTTVTGGTLRLGRSARGAATLARSSRVTLKGRSARLDLSRAGGTVRGLAGVAGSRVQLGGHQLTVRQTGSTTFAGTVDDGGQKPGRGGSVLLAGKGRLTLAGKVTAGGPVQVRSGSLGLADGAAVTGPVRVATGGVLAVQAGGAGALTSAGQIRLAGRLALRADLTQSPSGTLTAAVDGAHRPRIRVGGAVHLAGHLRLTGAVPPGSRFTLLDVAGKTRADGSFAGLAEGATVHATSGTMTISYRGGDGNDVVLTTRSAGLSAQLSDQVTGGPAHRSGLRTAVAVWGSLLTAALLGLFGGLAWFRRRRPAPVSTAG